MNESKLNEKNTEPARNPKVDLELMYMEEYLQGKGSSLKKLAILPQEEATKLRIEASQYASSRLEELESRARLLTDIHDVTDS